MGCAHAVGSGVVSGLGRTDDKDRRAGTGPEGGGEENGRRTGEKKQEQEGSSEALRSSMLSGQGEAAAGGLSREPGSRAGVCSGKRRLRG